MQILATETGGPPVYKQKKYNTEPHFAGPDCARTDREKTMKRTIKTVLRLSQAGLAGFILAGCNTDAASGQATNATKMNAPAANMADMRADANMGMSGMRDPMNRMMRLDLNGDGAIGFDEIRAARKQQHARLDQDKDGHLSAEEAGNFISLTPSGGREFAFLQADFDFDGRLSQHEFTEAPISQLARLDTDMDLRITEDEISALANRMRMAGGMQGGSNMESQGPTSETP